MGRGTSRTRFGEFAASSPARSPVETRSMARPPHQTTTRHLGAAYPFATEPGLGAGGVLVGRDLVGGGFSYDPFRLYHEGLLTNPNMVVIGQIGRGKSAFVKSYLWRQAAFAAARGWSTLKASTDHSLQRGA